ncbi:MAG: hypothetical protein INR68_07890 [Methylobacterium mesophilicum]|nr:hypothetical protein [Methylobacterium mesophilicum]
MSDQSVNFDENHLPAEDLAAEDRAALDMESDGLPTDRDTLAVDDWDGISPGSEEVSLEELEAGETANDADWEDDDDNPMNESDEALPDDSEESAIRQDLMESTEPSRFDDGQ